MFDDKNCIRLRSRSLKTLPLKIAMSSLTFKVLSSSTPAHQSMHQSQPASSVQPLQSSMTRVFIHGTSLCGHRRSLTRNSLPTERSSKRMRCVAVPRGAAHATQRTASGVKRLDDRHCLLYAPLNDVSKPTCSDSLLTLRPPAPVYIGFEALCIFVFLLRCA